MLDAVRYLVADGITWRAMPGDFPVWDRVYAFARRWGAQGLLAELHDQLRGLVRQEAGRDSEPTAAIVDSQSVRAAATVPASSRGYDAGKKVPGRKRHIVVDCLGLLLAVMVTTASVQDRHAAAPLLKRVRDRHRKIMLVWAEGGYAGRLREGETPAHRAGRQTLGRCIGVHGAAEALVRGADVRVVVPLAPAGARLRDTAHRSRVDGHVVNDHAHEPQAGPSASVNRRGAIRCRVHRADHA